MLRHLKTFVQTSPKSASKNPALLRRSSPKKCGRKFKYSVEILGLNGAQLYVYIYIYIYNSTPTKKIIQKHPRFINLEKSQPLRLEVQTQTWNAGCEPGKKKTQLPLRYLGESEAPGTYNMYLGRGPQPSTCHL